MNIVQAIVLGIVEGLTEFLPISSTFHLIFVSKFLGLQQTNFTKLFEVFIQSGAILSVLFLYFKTFTTDRETMKKVLLSFLPTAIIGFILYKVIKDVFFESSLLMITVFIAIGVFFIAYEWLIKKHKVQLSRSLATLTYAEAVIIGLIQALAIVPGVSRAGAVIVAMMILRFKRDESAKYSFLLSVPTIFAASAYDLFKMRQELVSSGNNILLLVIGFVSAFLSAYIVVKWFIRYLQTHSLKSFGIYRIVAGMCFFGIK